MGADAISLMTVHKSKGLEFHTVIFLGIDDDQWWSHSPGQIEGRSTFFVGLSRAEQRVFFTYCKQRGRRRKVAGLFELLEAAGVPEYDVNGST
jgi:superfamily I DNA/RNA helicase